MFKVAGILLGLALMYSLLSILVAEVNDIISDFLNWRAKRLKKELENLLRDTRLRNRVLSHPLIDIVDLEISGDEPMSNEKVKRVDWIAPSTFADVLVDLLNLKPDDDTFSDLKSALENISSAERRQKIEQQLIQLKRHGSGYETLYDLIDQIESKDERQAVREALAPFEDDIRESILPADVALKLRCGIEKLDDQSLKDALRLILRGAENLTDFKQKIQTWFEGGMKRASKLYKERMRLVSFFVSALLVIILNVDSLYVVRQLWLSEDQTRQDIISRALNLSPETPVIGSEDAVRIINDETSLNELLELFPVGWQLTESDDDNTEDETPDTPLALQFGGIEHPRYIGNLWKLEGVTWLRFVALKLLGWFITTLALLKGAPFWFNVLRRLAGDSGGSQK